MIPLFDLHCDTPYKLLGPNLNQQFSLLDNTFHIDLKRASKYGSYAQCFACYTSDIEIYPNGLTPTDVFSMELACITDQIDKNSDRISLVRHISDIYQNAQTGKASAILSLEGTAGIHYDPAALQGLRNNGFLITTLGWNEKNPLTGSHCTGGGLTDLGREFVQEAQRLGMIIDVSHISDEGFWNILDISTGPVIASHSNSRTVHPVTRNITDEMFMAICRTGGVAGINLFTSFLGEAANLDTVCDHIFHFLDLDPTGKHIALGGDLDGCKSLPDGFTGVESYSLLADQLIRRGLSLETVNDVFWNNAMGVIEACCT